MTTPRKKKKSIYMTLEAIRLKNKKSKLWKRYLATKSHFGWVNYRSSKNTLRSLTRRLR